MALIDIGGRRFGRILVICRDGSDRQGYATWVCRCDCGRTTVCIGRKLRAGRVRSCGCLRREGTKRRHGMKYTREYAAWKSMKDRCLNPQNKDWAYYGGRGITVCQEWRDSFEAFFAHIGPRISPKHSIDRIDNDGDYVPGNIRWATGRQQCLNRRRRNANGVLVPARTAQQGQEKTPER